MRIRTTSAYTLVATLLLGAACSSGDDDLNELSPAAEGSGGSWDPGPGPNPPPPRCGNGALDPGEACDATLFGGQTCSSETLGSRPLGALQCRACAVDVTGCTTSSGSGGSPAASGGSPSGTGGAIAGTGGAISGTGGAIAGTGGTTLGAGGATSGGETGRMVGFTELHNRVRRDVPTPNPLPDMTWSPEVAQIAQEYADQLAAQGCPMVHSNRPGYGENLAWYSGQAGTPESVVLMWASEVSCYTYGAFKVTDQCTALCTTLYGGCGHYTQIVWRGTTQVGCGMATCPGQEIWVCNYSPPGNYFGQPPY